LAGCPTPCDRTQFDDVLDYAGYTSTGIKDVSGSNIAGLESYNVTSIAVTADSFCTNPTTSANEAYKVIVTVQAPSGTQYTLTGYRCKS
jgi:MSHA pilin protein MshD